MKTIKKSVVISASKEKVWSVLLEDAYARLWLAVFGSGMHAKTDWIVGHKVKFLDDSKNGIVGRVTEKLPYETIFITYDGMIINGDEDYESEMAKAVKGSKEIYHLTDEGDGTRLEIECDMDDQMFDEMSRLWDQALTKIAALSLT